MSGKRRPRILVVDDDPAVVEYLIEALNSEGYDTHGMTSPQGVLSRFETEEFEALIADVEMPEMRGTDLLTAVKQRKRDQIVIFITAFGSIEAAVSAVRAGAYDFVTKPFKIEVLVLAIQRAFEAHGLRREIDQLKKQLAQDSPASLVARSPAMRHIIELARRAARTDITVLLTGESGTGKGALAKFIHDQSNRARKRFVAINCAALPSGLIESELFGVRKGAFTDAKDNREGLFVEANSGSLFLDEIGDMALECQAKLLQVVESGQVRALGGGDPVAVDLRILAATNRSLEEALRERRFRPDLYFRLNVIRIDLPPLRERQEDIPELVKVFVQRIGRRLRRSISGVSDEAMRWLIRYPWPGNVRELLNTIERAVALSEKDILHIEDIAGIQEAMANDMLQAASSKGHSLAHVEMAYIRKTLESTRGNVSQAARILGIDRRTLQRKLEDPGGASGERA